MEILENIYENAPPIPETFSRKMQILNKKTFILGPRFSGKTYLIFDYLQKHQIKNYLYIDLSDYKNKDIQSKSLEDFLKEKKITLLIVENYNMDFILPTTIEEIIITSYEYFNITGFHTMHLMPLDFEEYIAFDTKHQSPTISFNNFLKYGNLPDILEYKDIKKNNRNKELLNLLTEHPTKKAILFTLIKSIGQTHSPYYLYTNLKKEMKISKDFFYTSISEFEINHTLLLCPKYNHEKAPKKIFFYNYAYIDNVSYKKNFVNIFSNVIYLELFNKNFEIYYLENIDFYIPENKEIIIAMPFFNQIFFSNLSSKLLKIIDNIEIDNITIITISNENTLFLNDIEIRVIPFYIWSLEE